MKKFFLSLLYLMSFGSKDIMNQLESAKLLFMQEQQMSKDVFNSRYYDPRAIFETAMKFSRKFKFNTKMDLLKYVGNFLQVFPAVIKIHIGNNVLLNDDLILLLLAAGNPTALPEGADPFEVVKRKDSFLKEALIKAHTNVYYDEVWSGIDNPKYYIDAFEMLTTNKGIELRGLQALLEKKGLNVALNRKNVLKAISFSNRYAITSLVNRLTNSAFESIIEKKALAEYKNATPEKKAIIKKELLKQYEVEGYIQYDGKAYYLPASFDSNTSTLRSISKTMENGVFYLDSTKAADRIFARRLAIKYLSSSVKREKRKMQVASQKNIRQVFNLIDDKKHDINLFEVEVFKKTAYATPDTGNTLSMIFYNESV